MDVRQDHAHGFRRVALRQDIHLHAGHRRRLEGCADKLTASLVKQPSVYGRLLTKAKLVKDHKAIVKTSPHWFMDRKAKSERGSRVALKLLHSALLGNNRAMCSQCDGTRDFVRVFKAWLIERADGK